MSTVFLCPQCQAEWSRQPLTLRQHEVLAYVKGFIAEHGYAPSFPEIAEHHGFQSLATVHEHLDNIERKGWIKRGYNLQRAITLVEVPTKHPPACRCESCMTDAFGSPDSLPPDIEEQRDAVYGDLGVPTVSDPRD